MVLNKDRLAECLIEEHSELFPSRIFAVRVMTAILETITDELSKGNDVRLAQFGTFDTTVRKERAGVDPRSHEPIVIPSKRVVRFKSAANLRTSVANGNTVNE